MHEHRSPPPAMSCLHNNTLLMSWNCFWRQTDWYNAGELAPLGKACQCRYLIGRPWISRPVGLQHPLFICDLSVTVIYFQEASRATGEEHTKWPFWRNLGLVSHNHNPRRGNCLLLAFHFIVSASRLSLLIKCHRGNLQNLCDAAKGEKREVF